MKTLLKLLAFFVVAVSCTDDFESINTNPNNPETASESVILPSVIFDLTQHMVNETHNFGEVTAQYSARHQFNDLDLFRWVPDDRFWSPLYSIAQNIDDIEKTSEINANNNYLAVAKILKAYTFSLITDAYGFAPMSEANEAKEGINSPKYDSQEEIYKELFILLEEANSIINTSGTIAGDILYNGDMMKWKKFANSLHLRLLLHASSASDVSSAMSSIVDNPDTYPIFESNDDSAIYDYSGSIPDISSIVVPGGGRGFEYFINIPSTHLLNTLSKNSDPRLDIWISPRDCDPSTSGCTQDKLQGLAPGQSVGNIGSLDDYSRRSVAYFESATLVRGIHMTYSELNFILAEARELGYINTGSAKKYYEEAVAASFDQWNAVMPSDFLTNTAPYDSTTEVLHEQKWLALYHTGIEAWQDWKRTSKPSFIQAGPGTLNNNQIPVRLLYPPLEQSVNSENYNKASEAMGGDNLNASAWWW